MGDIADGLLDGSFDEYTGEYLGEPVGYPRSYARGYKKTFVKDTVAERKIKKVRKELAILIQTKQKEYPKGKGNTIVGSCRRYINLKYGHGWRERGLCSNDEDQWKENLNQYKNPEFNWDFELTKHKQ